VPTFLGLREKKAEGDFFVKLLIFNYFLKQRRKKERPEMVYHPGRIEES